MDASFVEVPRQRNATTGRKTSKSRKGKRPEGFEEGSAKGWQKDCDARCAKKNNQTHYGYKNHVKVDAKKKLVTKV